MREAHALLRRHCELANIDKLSPDEIGELAAINCRLDWGKTLSGGPACLVDGMEVLHTGWYWARSSKINHNKVFMTRVFNDGEAIQLFDGEAGLSNMHTLKQVYESYPDIRFEKVLEIDECQPKSTTHGEYL